MAWSWLSLWWTSYGLRRARWWEIAKRGEWLVFHFEDSGLMNWILESGPVVVYWEEDLDLTIMESRSDEKQDELEDNINLGNIEKHPQAFGSLPGIHSWTAKSLSYTGRVKLIPSALLSMTNYWCLHFVLPKEVIELVNKICSAFHGKERPQMPEEQK